LVRHTDVDLHQCNRRPACRVLWRTNSNKACCWPLLKVPLKCLHSVWPDRKTLRESLQQCLGELHIQLKHSQNIRSAQFICAFRVTAHLIAAQSMGRSFAEIIRSIPGDHSYGRCRARPARFTVADCGCSSGGTVCIGDIRHLRLSDTLNQAFEDWSATTAKINQEAAPHTLSNRARLSRISTLDTHPKPPKTPL
jgi:hypothetical protein